MKTERYVVCQCSYREIQGLIETKHYLKRRPQVTDSFALYDRETRHIVGALTIGKPASNSLCVGAIYQASNWLYTGKTPSRTDKFVPEGKHSRHYDKDQDNSVRVVRSSKHRYVMFVGTKGFKKWCMARLQYKVADYPKADLRFYDEDFKYEKKLVFNKQVGEV